MNNKALLGLTSVMLCMVSFDSSDDVRHVTLEGPEDVIFLNNGDVIKGRIVDMSSKVLRVKTSYSDTIKIRVDEIKSIETGKDVKVELKSGELLKGRIIKGEDGHVIVKSELTGASSSISWDEVKSINKPPVRLRGSINASLNSQSGNTDQVNGSLGIKAERKTDRDRFGFDFLFNYGEQENMVTTRNTYGAVKYDYFFNGKLYGFLTVEMLSDQFRDLDLRTITSTGAGYQLFDNDLSWLIELGVSYLSENFDEGKDEQRIAPRSSTKIDLELLDGLTLSENYTLYGNPWGNDYQSRNEISLVTSLIPGWSLKLSNILDYDNDPPPGVGKSDTIWLLGLRYSF